MVSNYFMRVGGYCCSPSAIPTHLQTTQSRYISTMLTLNEPPRAGTHARSLHWLSQILMTPRSTQSAVSPVVALGDYVRSNPVTDAHHRFIAEECDWGFTRFSELRKLFTVQDGYNRPTIEDECANISVFVRVLEDPTGVLWHNFVK